MHGVFPTTGTRHLHRDYNFTGSLVETAPKSLRHSCRSELRVIPLFPEAQTIPYPAAFRRARRLITAIDLPEGRTAISRPQYGRSVVTGSCVARSHSERSSRGDGTNTDFPRDYPLASTAFLGAAYEEGFPVISRFYAGNFTYPTRNFATLGSYPLRRRKDWTISSSRGRDVRRMASEDSRKHVV